MAGKRVVVRKVTVCGCGLIGGSILLDLQRRGGKSLTLVAHDRPRVLDKVRRTRHLKVKTEANLKRAVEDADIVVLSATQTANETILRRLARMKSFSDRLVLDTGSVKQPIADLARSLQFPEGTAFIPSHPMAGKEKAGFANAETGLFKGRCWFFDDSQAVEPAIRLKRDWLVAKTGADPVFIESRLHDELVAEISHLPQLLSSVLGAQINPDMIPLSGPGLHSMLRLAGSPWSVWTEIIDQNREKIVESLSLYRDNLSSVIELLRNGESLKEIFDAAARSYRCLS